MNIALFWGCKIPYYLSHYADATRAVLAALDLRWVDMEFNCCGYPTRELHFQSYLYSAARNLALAEAKGLDIVTPCKCCFGSLQHAKHWLRKEPREKEKINDMLAAEGLRWQDRSKVQHLLTLLFHDVGIKAIETKVSQPFEGVNIAAHYGCHALRPSSITGFDDPVAPTLFENLIAVTGAATTGWDKRLDCCGNPLWEKNPSLSLKLMHQKLHSARQAGADYLCTACTYCQIQFDTVQHQVAKENGNGVKMPSILYPQLLGMSLGINPRVLGIDQNKLDLNGIQAFRTPDGPSTG